MSIDIHSKTAPATPLGKVAPGRLRVRSTALFGVAILVLLALFGLLVPLLVEGSPTRQNLMHTLEPPGTAWLLGTDHLGRDMMLRVAAAIRTSLGIALLTTLFAGLVGVGLGVLAGVRGGLVDRLLSTVADMLLALPGLLLVLLLVALAPGQFWPLYLGISLVLWIEYFRMSRAAAIRVASSPAVEASRLLGFGPIYLFRRHFWPEMMATILVVGAFGAGTAIMSVAALGFISVGVRPPTPELGQMMIELLPYYHEAPWAIAQPVLVVFLAVLALNLIAGGRTQ